jgi:CRP/FNR family cyclic AMP-dependent transcriptional regulator
MQEIPLHEEMRMLSGADVLEVLSKEELEELAKRCPDVFFEPGEIFSTPEETQGKLFVLKEGRVQIYKLSTDGNQQTLAELEAGAALIPERLQGAYAQAIESTTIISISRAEMKRLIQKTPEVAIQLMEVLSRQLRQADERLADVALKEVPARLANLIVQLVESEGIVTREGHSRIPTRYTHERLATLIGARRVAVTRAFSTLREEGLLELRDRQILVKDMKALERTARG